MSDIFHEVDEEVRREQLKKLWDRYGTLIIAIAIVAVLAVAGWRAYQWWEAKRAAEAGAAFDVAAALSEEGKFAEAETAFGRVAADGTSGYRALARLRAAAALAERDAKAAVAAYDVIAADSSAGPLVQDLAGIRAGLLLIDGTPLTEITPRLDPLAQPDRPFRHSARELLALAAWKAGDAAAVKKWTDAIQSDPETPASIRSRVEILTTLTTETGKS